MKTLQIKDGDFVRVMRETKDGKEYMDWQYIEGADALIQRVKNRLKLFSGEWFIEPNEGIDWFGIFEKPFSINRMESAIYDSLSSDEDIESVDSIEIIPDYNKRSVTVTMELTAGDESITITEEMKD